MRSVASGPQLPSGLVAAAAALAALAEAVLLAAGGGFAAGVAAGVAGDALGHHAAAGHGLGVGHANLNVAGALDRNLAGDAAGVRFGAILRNALDAVDLAGLFADFFAIAANLDRARNALANLFAAGHGAFNPHRARNPHAGDLEAGAFNRARIARIAALVAIAQLLAQPLEAMLLDGDATAFVVTFIDALTNHLGHLPVGNALLHDRPLFDGGDAHANVAGDGLGLADLLVAADLAGPGFRNHFAAIGGVVLLAALGAIASAGGLIVLGDPLDAVVAMTAAVTTVGGSGRLGSLRRLLGFGGQRRRGNQHACYQGEPE